jgi:hypothetical protein
MLIIVALMITVAAFVYYTLRVRSFDSRLTERHNFVTTMAVQIICGDCSGDEGSPRKTYLDPRGQCNQCGGSSYVLASNRAHYAQTLMASHAASHAITGAYRQARVLRYVSRDNSEWETTASAWGGAA